MDISTGDGDRILDVPVLTDSRLLDAIVDVFWAAVRQRRGWLNVGEAGGESIIKCIGDIINMHRAAYILGRRSASFRNEVIDSSIAYHAELLRAAGDPQADQVCAQFGSDLFDVPDAQRSAVLRHARLLLTRAASRPVLAAAVPDIADLEEALADPRGGAWGATAAVGRSAPLDLLAPDRGEYGSFCGAQTGRLDGSLPDGAYDHGGVVDVLSVLVREKERTLGLLTRR